jgi:hypothetical protein
MMRKATQYFQILLEKDRDCEEIYRAVKRLQLKQSDWVAAIQTYHGCAQIVLDELKCC